MLLDGGTARAPVSSKSVPQACVSQSLSPPLRESALLKNRTRTGKDRRASVLTRLSSSLWLGMEPRGRQVSLSTGK